MPIIDSGYRAFARAFKPSERGNMWREMGEHRVTVFRREDGRYSWCVHDGERPRYSRQHYDTEAEALRALWDHVSEEVGDET
jgi:hypothetical protein